MTGTLPKVFMSHTSSDKPFVARLAADLARIGVGVWYDRSVAGSQLSRRSMRVSLRMITS
jgi:hypothetical protein